MNIEEKIQLIEEGTLEVIDTDELKEVLAKDEPIAYTGYEPSGKIHLGHAVTVQKLKQLFHISQTICYDNLYSYNKLLFLEEEICHIF